jgi:hypothetical protein
MSNFGTIESYVHCAPGLRVAYMVPLSSQRTQVGRPPVPFVVPRDLGSLAL